MKNSALGHRTSKLLLLFFFSNSLPDTMIYEVDFFKIELPSGLYMLVIKYQNMKEQNKYCLIVKHFFFFADLILKWNKVMVKPKCAKNHLFQSTSLSSLPTLNLIQITLYLFCSKDISFRNFSLVSLDFGLGYREQTLWRPKQVAKRQQCGRGMSAP